MSPRCHETFVAHDGAVGEDETDDHLGSPERLFTVFSFGCWVREPRGCNARYRSYGPSAVGCCFADASSCTALAGIHSRLSEKEGNTEKSIPATNDELFLRRVSHYRSWCVESRFKDETWVALSHGSLKSSRVLTSPHRSGRATVDRQG